MAEPIPGANRRDERLPLGVKLAFGAPTFAGAAMAIPIAIHLTKFYADVMLVPLGVLGVTIALARALDAVTDPLMGWLSDRTRSRWGRRRPYLAVGAPLCAVSFWALFSPPESLGGAGAVIWFGSTFALYYLFHTVYVIPHVALGPELSLDYHERSTLYAMREAFLVLGTLCAALVPGLLVHRLGDERAAFSIFAAVFGGLLVLLYGWLVARVRERPEFARRTPNPLAPGVRRALANRPFRILLGTSLAGGVPGVLAGSMMPFFVSYVLRPENPSLWLSIFLAVFFGSGLLFLPLWLRAARRFGKRPVWLFGFVMSITGAGPTFLLGEGDLLATAMLLAWAGSSFGASSFLGLAIKADVIDYDELLTGKRREAQFTALWSILPKFVIIPGAAIPIAILGTLGYVPNAPQSPEVLLAIRALFGLATAAFSALALGIAWRLPMTESIHREIQRAIEGRARGEAVTDPISGWLLAAPGSAGIDEDSRWFLDHFSRGELRRVLEQGPRTLVRDVSASCAAALAVALLAAWFVATQLAGLRAEPGPPAVLGVVVCGFAFSMLVFHLLRLRAALRFDPDRFPASRLRAHLDQLGEPARRGVRALSRA